MSSSASGGVVGGGGSASASVSSSLGLDADAKYLKRKVKAGSLDVHPTEKALVVNYELVRERLRAMVMDGVKIDLHTKPSGRDNWQKSTGCQFSPIDKPCMAGSYVCGENE